MSFPTVATLQRLLGQYGVTYLSRSNWGHTAKLGPAMPGFARGLHVHHSVTVFDDDGDHRSTDDVVADMKEIERIGKQRFGRYSYSFAIHPSGVVAEGAGFTIGAHTANFNSSTFGIVFIGNLDRDPLTREMVASFKALVTVLRLTDALTDDCYIKPHRDRKATACPGANTIKGWADLTNLATIPVPSKLSVVSPRKDHSMSIINIKGSSYNFLHMGGRDFIPLTEERTYELAAAGIPRYVVSNEAFQVGEFSMINGTSYRP